MISKLLVDILTNVFSHTGSKMHQVDTLTILRDSRPCSW